MKAIILAAGKGSRLYPITLNKPKGLLEIGNETILDRLIRQFKAVGIEDILLVVGHQKEKMQDHFGGKVRYREYLDFNITNNLHTLWSVKDELNGDVIITFADLVIHDDAIKKIIHSGGDDIVMAIDTSRVLEGTARVEVDQNILKSINTTTEENASGNFIGLAKITNNGCKILLKEMKILINGNYDDYYTLAIDKLARRGELIGSCDIKGMLWREIDTGYEYEEVQSLEDEFNAGIQ